MRVAIIGAGAGGAGCALGLLHGAARQGVDVTVTLFEPKSFGEHYNQCMGVLTPGQVERDLAEWGLEIPAELIQRRVASYVLHAGASEIALGGGPDMPDSCVTRRVHFDAFLEAKAQSKGADVHGDRVTDIEFVRDEALIYTEGRTCRADFVVGAFGLDPGTAAILARRTAYRPPPAVGTLVRKIHFGEPAHVEGLLGDCIHAFVPRLRRVQFGALVPKGNHVSAIVAGRHIVAGDMETFLELPEVASLLPPDRELSETYRGNFPAGVARGISGRRHLVVGDASGFVRPLKGGGIHAALTTGRRAARALLEHGPSRQAGRSYERACAGLRRDIAYGRVFEWALALLTGMLRMEPVIDLANRDSSLRHALFACVSGSESYALIARRLANVPLVARAVGALATDLVRRPARRT